MIEPDGHPRVEARLRVLEDHLHLRPERPQRPALELGDVAALELDRAGRSARRAAGSPARSSTCRSPTRRRARASRPRRCRSSRRRPPSPSPTCRRKMPGVDREVHLQARDPDAAAPSDAMARPPGRRIPPAGDVVPVRRPGSAAGPRRGSGRRRGRSAARTGRSPASAISTGGWPSIVRSRRSRGPVDARHRAEQRPGVGMLRIGEDRPDRPVLDHLARRTSPSPGRRCRRPARGRG